MDYLGEVPRHSIDRPSRTLLVCSVAKAVSSRPDQYQNQRRLLRKSSSSAGGLVQVSSSSSISAHEIYGHEPAFIQIKLESIAVVISEYV